MNPNFQIKVPRRAVFTSLFVYLLMGFFVKNNLIGKEVREIAGFVYSELVIESGELSCVWILWR